MMKKDYRIQSLPRTFEQVAKQIVQYMKTEKLGPGDKLPTERQLAGLLEVSRSSVREGIRVLELLHFLESKQGEGTFVATPPPFLLPATMIGQELDSEACDHYFEIALLCAEKIFLQTLRQKTQQTLKRVDANQEDGDQANKNLVGDNARTGHAGELLGAGNLAANPYTGEQLAGKLAGYRKPDGTPAKETFWNSFHALLQEVAANLENPYFLLLWTDTFQLLAANGYFTDKKAPFALPEFVAALANGKEENIRKFLNLLTASL